MEHQTIWLIRHAQYEPCKNSDHQHAELDELNTLQLDGPLSVMGRSQAEATASFLKQYITPNDVELYSSDLLRCRETINIITDKFEKMSVNFISELRESLPTRPEFDDPKLNSLPDDFFENARKRADSAFEFIQGRLRDTASSNLILCSHGNLIRYLICRFIGAPASCWERFDINNCGLVKINLEGDLFYVVHVNAVGHLPSEF